MVNILEIHSGNNIVNVHEIVIDATYLYTEKPNDSFLFFDFESTLSTKIASYITGEIKILIVLLREIRNRELYGIITRI